MMLYFREYLIWLGKILNLKSHNKKATNYGKVFEQIVLGKIKTDLWNHIRTYK